jgi:hypothetical protein
MQKTLFDQDLRKIVLARRIDDPVPGYGEEITTTPGRFCVSPVDDKKEKSLNGANHIGFEFGGESGIRTRGGL